MRRPIFKAWKTAPISATCEVLRSGPERAFCGKPTTHAYPAAGGGWQSLCYEHGQSHLNIAKPITELFLQGETVTKRESKSAQAIPKA